MGFGSRCNIEETFILLQSEEEEEGNIISESNAWGPGSCLNGSHAKANWGKAYGGWMGKKLMSNDLSVYIIGVYCFWLLRIK